MKKKNEKPLKFFKNSKLTISKIDGYTRGRNIFNGEIVKVPRIVSEEAINDISLGSLAKPNKKIVKIRYD